MLRSAVSCSLEALLTTLSRYFELVGRETCAGACSAYGVPLAAVLLEVKDKMDWE